MAGTKILVAQGGGPTAVINQSLVGVALEARRHHGVERVYGARHGVRGIVDEDFVDLTQETSHNLELVAATPGAWMPQQFENPANVQAHVRTTAAEILADFPQGIDALITGVGTGGHLSGCARVLKARWPQLKVYAVEPAASPVISGGAPAPHPIQGIGAGFVPINLHTDLLDGVIQVDAEAAREMARRCAREEGMLVGISSGATLAAIAQKLPDLPAGATVLGFNYDTGERYLSIEGFLPT